MSDRLTTIGNGLVFGGAFLALHIVLTLLFFPTVELPLSSCTDVGYANGPPGGFVYYEYAWLWMEYSPDGGVNRCGTPIVTIAAGLFAVGGAIRGLERWKR